MYVHILRIASFKYVLIRLTIFSFSETGKIRPMFNFVFSTHKLSLILKQLETT